MLDAYSSSDGSCTEETLCFGRTRDDDTKLRIVRRELASNYKRYRTMAARRLRDDVAADDVVQAFALKALERAEQLRDIQAVHGWLRRLFETTVGHCQSYGMRSPLDEVRELGMRLGFL